MMQNNQTKKQTFLKAAICTSLWLFTIALYFAFGFFFDVFAEIIPIFLLPILVSVLLSLRKKDLKLSVVIAMSVILIVLSVGATAGVGAVATSNPGYGEKIKSGKVETINYSRSFMKENYDINQKTQVKIWLPERYDASEKYPVLYVLDGDVLFHYAALSASKRSLAGDGDVIVVGIGYGYWNSTFARGGLMGPVLTKTLRGRWRDYCFADDTQEDYLPGTILGGKDKRGKEYTDYIVNTVVKDVGKKYSVDTTNSTIFGHSLGGGLAAYFMTQYKPNKDAPFTGFVIVDNGYIEYYNRHLSDLRTAMEANGNRTYNTVKTYRIWGGSVNPEGDAEQRATYKALQNLGYEGMENYFWIPEGANHGDTQTIGIDNALNMILDLDFGQNKDED